MMIYMPFSIFKYFRSISFDSRRGNASQCKKFFFETKTCLHLPYGWDKGLQVSQNQLAATNS